ncbi:LppU/SCO3897 family protein [Streptomyces sp. NPDC001927]
MEQQVSSPEFPLTLSPQQAATGVIITVQLPTGPTNVSIPPCRDGDLVPAQAADGSVVLLRIRVNLFAGSAQAAPPRKSGILGCLAPLVVVGVIAFLIFSNSDSDSTDNAGGSGSTTAPSPSFSSENPLDSTTAPTPDPTQTTEPAPDPYTKGTCLNGELPNSETAQSVSGVEEVACSAKDAHYKVIQTFPLTSDLNRCNSNPKTEYAFSHRYTINGATINEYVYCLVGLGSYARN